MPAYRRKLIEVALQLEAINEASSREKSIRYGHPSTLHLWWAKQPVAACRAILFGSTNFFKGLEDGPSRPFSIAEAQRKRQPPPPPHFQQEGGSPKEKPRRSRDGAVWI